jgi:hypothetical protein
MSSLTTLAILKRNLAGMETWRYDGQVLAQTPTSILIEAFFNRPDMPFQKIILCQGDRFLEAYYKNHWYNIFEIHDRQTDQLKAWYCNITLPATFTPHTIEYVDLALDLFVYPNGEQVLLDEDEFAELQLSVQQRQQAWNALQELRQLFATPINFDLRRDWLNPDSGFKQNQQTR